MSGKKATKAIVAAESKEQVQQRLKKEVELVAEETKVKIFGWYGILIENLRAVSRMEGVDIDVESRIMIEKALEDLEIIMVESKRKLVTVGSLDLFSGIEEKVVLTAVVAQTQALNSFDQIKAAVRAQTLSLEQIFTYTKVCEIEESLDYKLTLFKQRIGHSFEYAAGATIAAAFEGKTITWIESTEMPESFGSVRAFAFDLVGTVTDHVTTIAQVWSTLIQSKGTNTALNKIDITAFALKWHKLFIERRAAGLHQSLTDSALLRLILVELLKEHHVCEELLTDAERDQLTSVWSKLDLFHDALAGIGRIKKQSIQDTIAVAFSSSFSTRTMINLARHGCLCWNAQFGADMFGSKTAESVVGGMSNLLALNGPEEIAVVSANTDVLEAAKARGNRTVHIHRVSHDITGSQQFDLEIDGIDMLAESYETMLEKQSKKTIAPVQRSWFQRIVGTASDAATAVQKTFI
ncbi:hypothetical protein BX666DRAFT_444502 [Dichotomocladium elegans]|nr:hypothetical protein BX666DRAFT_444502 [Dichotomocladium elegans]